jgi:hypothetical protein
VTQPGLPPIAVKLCEGRSEPAFPKKGAIIMAAAPRAREIAISAAWHSGEIPAHLITAEGQAIEVVHRGTWSHGLGPDFRDALILVDGRELRAGDVEIHLRTRGWTDHGHHLDAAYDAVILHVVAAHDGSATRRHDGALVPVVAVGPADRFAVPDLAAWDWERVGGGSCAAALTAARPRLVRETLFRLGDARLATRAARLEARLVGETPAQILWEEVLDGLGFATNREPMRALARVARLQQLEDLLQTAPTAHRLSIARGVLLGAAGFLPLSPAEAHLGRLSPDAVESLETAWQARGAPWRGGVLPATVWQRARVRPANHPVPRLLTAAAMLAAASADAGLLPVVLRTLLERGDPVAALTALSAGSGAALGSDRARDIMASGVIPFALALANHAGDEDLAAAAAFHWERLPAPAANAVVRRAARQVAGSSPLGKIGARGAQGLLQIDTTLCQPRRCFECPIAALALASDD